MPCLNEEATLGNVIKNVRKYLPESKIVVYDNNSTDKTTDVAEYKVKVRKVARRGRGNVVRKMFSDNYEYDYYNGRW